MLNEIFIIYNQIMMMNSVVHDLLKLEGNYETSKSLIRT